MLREFKKTNAFRQRAHTRVVNTALVTYLKPTTIFTDMYTRLVTTENLVKNIAS